VYANKIATIKDPAESAAFVAERIAEYEADVDLARLASDLVIDASVPHDELHDELVARFRAAANKDRFFSDRRHGNPPV
jgi:acetyl-CoA carboxylase carboxyltransferase component